ncbi:MAG: GTPase Era, partial [Halanaerobiales bacterium]
MTYKSGFTTIIGRPNVGKSTLINKIIGKKISITSPKPQTTRNKIQAVYSTDNGQIVFVDTPGIHKAKNKLDKYMLSQAFKSLEGIDLIIFLVDATSTFGKGDKFIYQQLKETGVPVTVVMNKIDKLDTGTIAARLKNYQKHTNQEVIPVSARSGKNIESLVDNILSNFDEGPQYYP